MTDKVSLIRAEIERLYKDNDNVGKMCYNQALQDIQTFIDSLPEEPVSEELEEAAEKYAYELFPSIGVANTETELAFKAGAQWKENQMIEHTVKAEVSLRLMPDGKNFFSFDTCSTNLQYSECDKVKLIVIKEE